MRLILELFGKADETVHINSPFCCDYGANIRVGKNFFANYHCTILDNAPVTIGDDVMFAPNVSLYTVGHPLDADLRLAMGSPCRVVRQITSADRESYLHNYMPQQEHV